MITTTGRHIRKTDKYKTNSIGVTVKNPICVVFIYQFRNKKKMSESRLYKELDLLWSNKMVNNTIHKTAIF